MYQVLALNLISFWILRYLLAYIFSEIIGEDGIAYGIGVSFMISSVIALLYYCYGKWRENAFFLKN
ncbi:hypothetical protein [Gracilibacillus boraciitolerans]